MRKVIVALAALCGLFSLANAQSSEELIKTIAKKAASHPTYSAARFRETRTPAPASNRKAVTLEGKLDYKTGTYLSMVYDNKELFLIDGNSMTIKREGKPEQKFDTSRNIMMRGLQHALLFSFGGKLEELSDEQKTRLTAVKVKDGIEATLTATKKQARGYCRIIVLYSNDGKVIQMQMDEFGGASTFYKFL